LSRRAGNERIVRREDFKTRPAGSGNHLVRTTRIPAGGENMVNETFPASLKQIRRAEEIALKSR
jgi:hypothetical protein